MNHFKRASDRISWCEFRRLQSTLSASTSKIQIPSRIKRGPTDILSALERTIPKDSMNHNYAYHDDPFLVPQNKVHYRNYALSYEAGKKAAMWVHRKHADLFPKQLSEPEIKAFKPVTKYTDESQVSNEILSQTIAEYKIFDAISVYKLLGSRATNQTKQELLELLCFYNDESNSFSEFPLQRWFVRPDVKHIWRFNPVIQELYESLATQDPSTAAAAHNTMICGLAKYSRIEEAFTLYQDCQKKDIPLNVTTYNYILLLVPQIFGKRNKSKQTFIFDVLQSMKDKGVKPNVRTLNSALKAVMQSDTENIVKYLLAEFKRMNIKFSLATYYYILLMFTQMDNANSNFLKDIVRLVQTESFTVQDPDDSQFFPHAMYLADHYFDRTAGDMIHGLLLTGDNQKFMSSAMMENIYYMSYLSLLLSTSPTDEYFEIYGKLVPRVYVPKKGLLKKMISTLNRSTPEIIAKYLPKLWTDINTYCRPDLSMKLDMIRMMQLAASSQSRISFVDEAWDCWESIKLELKEKPQIRTPIETDALGTIALILLRGDRAKQSVEVLKSTVEQADSFIPTMNDEKVNELFEACVSQDCIQGAILVLEYSANSGFPHVVDMAMKLHNLPQLTKVERDRLANLMRLENS